MASGSKKALFNVGDVVIAAAGDSPFFEEGDVGVVIGIYCYDENCDLDEPFYSVDFNHYQTRSVCDDGVWLVDEKSLAHYGRA